MVRPELPMLVICAAAQIHVQHALLVGIAIGVDCACRTLMALISATLCGYLRMLWS
jgi:hypothetical protein